MKYIALLRGINVGGNNTVSMAELKQCFESLGFTDVKTYINSGNVIFEEAETSKTILIEHCESVIKKKFGFHVICAVITAKELAEAAAYAPKWWGTGPDKHNALFIIPPETPETIMKEVGEAKPEYEKIAAHGPVIFWTAPLKTFNRTRYSKIVGTKAYKSVTIRNANTVKKLVALTT